MLLGGAASGDYARVECISSRVSQGLRCRRDEGKRENRLGDTHATRPRCERKSEAAEDPLGPTYKSLGGWSFHLSCRGILQESSQVSKV